VDRLGASCNRNMPITIWCDLGQIIIYTVGIGTLLSLDIWELTRVVFGRVSLIGYREATYNMV
jgi:uncharacterized membrane protein